MATRGKKKFSTGKEVKRLARQRVGVVPPGRPIEDKRESRKAKHKKPPGDEP